MLGSGRCLGVDVGGDDIKVVELRKTGKTFEVIQAARIKLPAGDGATALGHFLLETATYPANVVCSLPTNACSVKFAEVPAAKPVQLARMVRFEAESQVPLPLGEVNWDFMAVGPRKEATRHVSIAAARSALVDETLLMMDSAHAHPSIVTVSALAAARAVASAESDWYTEPALVIDIGAKWTDFCAIEGGRLYGCRSVKFGSNDLTEALCHDFKVDDDEAEKMKRSRGVNLDVRLVGSETAAENSYVERWVEKMSEEVRRSAQAVTSTAQTRPRRAILVGGIADIPGLANSLGRGAGIPVEVGDPWAGMTRSEVCAHNLRESPAAFAVATGLARAGLESGSRVDLMPRRLADERLRRRKEVTSLVGLGATAAVLLAIWLGGQPSLNRQNTELEKLNSRVKLAQRQVRRSGPNLGAKAIFVTKTVKAIRSGDTSCLELLKRLSDSLPRSVWLTEMSFDNGKSVVLKGGSLSNSAVADTIDSLTLLEIFDSVTLDYSNLAKGEGSQSYDFQITCAVPSSQDGLLTFKAGGGGKTGPRVRTGINVQ